MRPVWSKANMACGIEPKTSEAVNFDDMSLARFAVNKLQQHFAPQDRTSWLGLGSRSGGDLLSCLLPGLLGFRLGWRLLQFFEQSRRRSIYIVGRLGPGSVRGARQPGGSDRAGSSLLKLRRRHRSYRTAGARNISRTETPRFHTQINGSKIILRLVTAFGVLCGVRYNDPHDPPALLRACHRLRLSRRSDNHSLGNAGRQSENQNRELSGSRYSVREESR